MRRRRFFTRLFASLFGVGVITALVVSWSDDRAFRRASLDLMRSELEQQALVLEQLALPALRDPAAVDALRERVTALGAVTDTRFTVVAPGGRVLAESDEDPRQLDDHAQRPEIVQARSEGVGVARRTSSSIGHELVYLARAVRGDAGELLGFVRVARTATAFDAVLAASRQQLWVALATGLLTSALLAWLLARRIAHPIAVLRQTAHAMASNDDHRRASIDGDEEFAELGRVLNKLADRLQDRVAEMQAERAKLSAILAGMIEGVAAVDVDERILHLNGAAAELLGIEDRDVLGRPLVEVTRVPEICDLATDTLTNGDVATLEASIRRDGETRTVHIEATPLRDGDGEVRGAVLVMHDVTDLRRLESMRRDFVANASHELKTPLTAIKGMIDTIVEDPEMPDETRRRFLEKAQRQADRLGNLVTDLLVLARVESSKPGDEMQPLDLRSPVRESCQQLAVTAQQKQLGLHLSLPDLPVVVRGEAEALRQVVDNLLSNAIRYTPERGEIHVTLVARDGDALLSVRDTGIGIAPEHLDRIFARFYRVDKARSRELGGTGLGLAIVKHVALAHGGSVTVSSQIGAGSTFSVRIPIGETAPSTAA